jgi:hypothetical protein
MTFLINGTIAYCFMLVYTITVYCKNKEIVRPILNIYQIYYELIMYNINRDTLSKSTKPLMVGKNCIGCL